MIIGRITNDREAVIELEIISKEVETSCDT